MGGGGGLFCGFPSPVQWSAIVLLKLRGLSDYRKAWLQLKCHNLTQRICFQYQEVLIAIKPVWSFLTSWGALFTIFNWQSAWITTMDFKRKPWKIMWIKWQFDFYKLQKLEFYIASKASACSGPGYVFMLQWQWWALKLNKSSWLSSESSPFISLDKTASLRGSECISGLLVSGGLECPQTSAAMVRAPSRVLLRNTFRGNPFFTLTCLLHLDGWESLMTLSPR